MDGCIEARILRPSVDAESLMVYYHGGGWVVGNIDDYDCVGRHLAHKCKAVVVMVNYRKAPEFPFPIPMQDSYAALKWVDAHRNDLGLDGLPMVVAGDSAGGNLATVMAHRSLAEGGPEIDLQVLVYPVIDGQMSSESQANPDNQLFLTHDVMAYFWDHYASDSDRLNPLASPILKDDLSGFTSGHRHCPQSSISCETRAWLTRSGSVMLVYPSSTNALSARSISSLPYQMRYR